MPSGKPIFKFGTCPRCGANKKNGYAHAADCYANLPDADSKLGRFWLAGWNSVMIPTEKQALLGETDAQRSAFDMGARCARAKKAARKSAA